MKLQAKKEIDEMLLDTTMNKYNQKGYQLMQHNPVTHKNVKNDDVSLRKRSLEELLSTSENLSDVDDSTSTKTFKQMQSNSREGTKKCKETMLDMEALDQLTKDARENMPKETSNTENGMQTTPQPLSKEDESQKYKNVTPMPLVCTETPAPNVCASNINDARSTIPLVPCQT